MSNSNSNPDYEQIYLSSRDAIVIIETSINPPILTTFFENYIRREVSDEKCRFLRKVDKK